MSLMLYNIVQYFVTAFIRVCCVLRWNDLEIKNLVLG